ncbi:hypothetical protein J7T55_012792 [Diaporthe amygdali]|uniref:uncharacterized protein n=1 Tax=Phomopsis amygdali TaxID=1214568 RepID=UPI0022FF27CF|nr:uncharacterized protein J7T55_012792 [Diaporthe amygdali]KAJ0115512.1 hypothetical protein J7T55_012792 [Diaporthe amygdali]
MSSRFVSGGITDTKTGDIAPADPSVPSDTTNTSSSSSSKKSEEWAAVQAQLEEERRRRQQQREAAQTGTAGEEKSLYEVLQANKAAKQAAFEEANKIKNQFRPLDDDEVEFLDGVRERKRLEEERLRRETEEGLRGFRELQQKASAPGEGPEDEGAAAEAGDIGGWSVGRKRKRRKDEPESVLKGLKRRGSSAADGGEGAKVEEKGRDAAADAAAGQKGSAAAPKGAQDTQAPLAKPATPAAAKPKAGLVDYGSDDDSD